MLAVVMLICACSQSPHGKYPDGKDSMQRNGGSSHALNNLRNSEHYENVGRINERIIRRSKDKFNHTAKKGSDTLVVRSKMPANPGVSLFVQFDVIHQQAINLSLRVSYTGRNCLFSEKYRLVVDHQSFDLVPSHVNRLQNTNCMESADFDRPLQAMMDAISHASTVSIVFTRDQSVITSKVSRESIGDCREAYEYYLALGGKF